MLSAIADVGIVLLMFTIGLEFSLKRIFNLKSYVWQIALLQIVLSSFFLGGLLCLFKFPVNVAVMMGILFSFSSTVIVAKLITEDGSLHAQSGELSIIILLIQDLIVMPISILLPLMLTTTSFDFVLFTSLLFAIGKSTLIFVLIILFAKKIIPFVLHKVSGFVQADLLLISIVCSVTLFASISEMLGLSLAVGAFIAGMIISVTQEKNAVFSEIRPLRDIFSIIFFLYLGFSINLEFVFRHFFQIALIALCVIAIKFLIVYVLLRKYEIHKKHSLKIAAQLSQISEFAFILSLNYFKNGIIDIANYNYILSITLLTIIISPIFINYIKHVVRKYKFMSNREKNELVFGDNINLERHIVLCGFGRIGKQIVKHLLLNNIPFVVIDDNKKEIDLIKSRGLNAIYGDATQIEILNYASVSRARLVVLAIPDRFSQEIIISHVQRLNPQAVIYGRVHNNNDKKYLYALGVRYVLFPEFEGAMAFSKRILKIFGISDEKIAQSADKIFYDEKII
jgi:CPA2 family monovalent cation:H+ antiporter-2